MRAIELTLSPEEYYDQDLRREAAARACGMHVSDVGHVEVIRRSLDSRRGIRYRTQAEVYGIDEIYEAPDYKSDYHDVTDAHRVVIVGAGPAGLFAALHALELGIKPIIVERGKPVEERRKDLTVQVRRGKVDGDSNWCFGEGGAGTYSDGKLYTRSTKRGDVGGVMRKFVEHGADRKIMIDTHAHIGTDRLSGIIANMRKTIVEHGGEMLFGKRVAGFVYADCRPAGDERNNANCEKTDVRGVRCADGEEIVGNAVVLATGHSARDIYEMFATEGWLLEAKPFAMGVRVEHPQQLINEIQYHGKNHSPLLPPAAYSLTTQAGNHGVFSFCMCPGGVIVPAATADGEQVVNGMSNASRSSAFANSGIAVTVGLGDVPEYQKYGPLALLRFQQDVERRAAECTGGGLKAPCQTLTDFMAGRGSTRLNRTNYMGETVACRMDEVLPRFVGEGLRQGFRDFDRKMRGFITHEASLLAVESRTSSPLRIPRDEGFEHPQLRGLYPCGEGAGYAGGIVSSALDGINVMDRIALKMGLINELTTRRKED